MLFLLIGLLVLLLCANYFANDRIILSPAMIFTASFAVSCFWALLYKEKWNLYLHWNTFLVIFLGVLGFSIVCFIVNSFYNNMVSIDEDGFSENVEYQVNFWKMVFTILIELLSIVYTIHVVKVIVPGGSLSDSIYEYRSKVINPILSSSLPALPGVLIFLRLVTDALGYYFAFLLARLMILQKKTNIMFIIIIGLSIANSLLLGSRTGSFTLLLCFLVYLYSINQRKNVWQGKLSSRTIMLGIVLAVIVLLAFQGMASLLGRTVDDMSMKDYLAMYVGAEIKNLDVFLQNGMFPKKSGIWGGQTFYYLNRTFANFIGIKNFKLSLDIPFLYVNGKNLGNVYTTFYAYIYDFGYTGAVFIVGLMAALSQIVFEQVKRLKDNHSSTVYLLIYGQIVTSLALSFFSNKFYEQLFNTSFFKMVILWLVFDWFYSRKINY